MNLIEEYIKRHIRKCRLSRLLHIGKKLCSIVIQRNIEIVKPFEEYVLLRHTLAQKAVDKQAHKRRFSAATNSSQNLYIRRSPMFLKFCDQMRAGDKF